MITTRNITRRLAACAALTASLAVPAWSDLDVAIDNGTRIDGDVAPSELSDTFRVALPAGAKLKVSLKALKGGGPPPAFSVNVLDAAGGAVVAGTPKKTSVRVKNHIVATSGEHRIVVTTDGSSPGSYRMSVKWVPQKKVRRDVTFTGEGAEALFAGEADATLTCTVRASKRSAALPRLEQIAGPTGYSFDEFAPAAPDQGKHTAKGVRLGGTGDYTLSLTDAGTGGDAVASLRMKLAKITKAKVDLTDEALGGSGGGASGGTPDKAFGALATPAAGVALSLPDEEAGILRNAGINVPAGALTSPAMMVIGEAPTQLLPPETDLQAAGPTVFFGPPGTMFAIPAIVTIPFDTTGLGGNFASIRVYRRDEDGTVALVDPTDYTFDAVAGAVSFPVSHFTSFRAFSVTAGAGIANEAALVSDVPTRFMHFGDVVAISGDTLVVGAPFDDRFASDGGAVYVFERTNGVWGAPSVLQSPDLAADDQFGFQVALDGDRLVATAPRHANVSAANGKVYAFERVNGSFVFDDAFTIQGFGTNGFGQAIDMDGTRVVVGFGNESVGGESLAGAVYVYDHDGQGWGLTRRIEDDPAERFFAARFGHDVAVDGDRMIISLQGANRGYVYELVQGVWTEVARLEVTADVGVDSVSDRVTLSGNTAVLADAFDDRDGSVSSNYGALWAFHFDGTTWGLEKKITLADGERSDKFGTALELHGDTLIVGALGRGAGNAGSATVFQRRGGAWPLLLEYVPTGIGFQDQLGTAVDLEGDTIVVGAPFADVGVPEDEGRVHLFDLVLTD